MNLNNRGVMDPRWAFHHRPVARGAMMCRGTVYRLFVPSLTQQRAEGWQPLAPNASDRIPPESHRTVAVYSGPARVQPQLGWRARKQNGRDRVVTEAGFGIQLDFRENDLRDAEINNGSQFPRIVPNDFFRVDEVFSWGDIEVDPALKEFNYIIRTLTPSSNSWTRNLMCDVTPGTVISAS